MKSIRGHKIELHIIYVVWVVRINIKNKSTLRSLGRIKGCEKKSRVCNWSVISKPPKKQQRKNFLKKNSKTQAQLKIKIYLGIAAVLILISMQPVRIPIRVKVPKWVNGGA